MNQRRCCAYDSGTAAPEIRFCNGGGSISESFVSDWTRLSVRTIFLNQNSENRHFLLRVLRQVALEGDRLKVPHTGEVGRVEVEDHPVAAEVLEARGFAVLRGKREIGSKGADLGRTGLLPET